MLLNLSKDSGILSKNNFGVSHPFSHGSLCSSKGLRCNHDIVDNGHDGKKILSSDVDRCHCGEDEQGPAGEVGAGGEDCAVGIGVAGIGSEAGAADIVMWGS